MYIVHFLYSLPFGHDFCILTFSLSKCAVDLSRNISQLLTLNRQLLIKYDAYYD